jgi:adenylate cyclase, class 2
MGADNYSETEVKLYVPDLSAVAQRLESLRAELLSSRIFERNVRYENAEKTLTSSGIVVRLRQDNRVRLTYKELPQKQTDIDIPSRYEAEVEVSNFDAMEVILGKLGYFPHLIYEKYRTTYQWEDAEIVLDELPYGKFVEIEGDVETIRHLITKLELQAARRYDENYVKLFENVKQRMNLNFNDLTFQNFNGIDVPQTAFEA